MYVKIQTKIRINLEIQKKKINPCQKYDRKAILINQYIRVFKNFWKWLATLLFKQQKSFMIPITTKAALEIKEKIASSSAFINGIGS